MNPADMDPPWSEQHSNAAIAEGWEIFDCEDSSNGRWQVDELDDPSSWIHLTGGVAPPKLDDNEAAWAIVANGTLLHHEAARAFLQTHNPQEYALVMQQLKENP